MDKFLYGTTMWREYEKKIHEILANSVNLKLK